MEFMTIRVDVGIGREREDRGGEPVDLQGAEEVGPVSSVTHTR
jgi:hypothetical protein